MFDNEFLFARVSRIIESLTGIAVAMLKTLI